MFLCMDNPIDLSIIIPCYNEADRLSYTIKETVNAALDLNINYEILLVNDWSRDTTHNVMLSLSKQYPTIKVLSYSINRGKWYAVRYWVEHSKGSYYLIMDADLATDISALKKIWSIRETSDCIIGNRKSDETKMSFFRSLAGLIAHFIITKTLDLHVQDTQCGFKLLSASTKPVWSSMYIERRGFDFELLYLLHHKSYTIKELPVKWTAIAGSKVTILSYRTTLKELYTIVRLHKIHIFKHQRS